VIEWGSGTVVPRAWVTDSSMHYRADLSGTSVYPWLPKGHLSRIPSFVVNGVIYIFLPQCPPGYIFPSARDLTLMSPDVGSDLVTLDPYSNCIKAEGVYDSYQNKYNRSYDLLVGALIQSSRTNKILAWSDRGLTPSDLRRMLPYERSTMMTIGSINHHLSTVSDVYRWSGYGPSTQWVHKDAIDKTFPGTPPEGVFSSLCGKSVAAFLSEARTLRRSTWSYHDQAQFLRPVIDVLELNGASAFISFKGPSLFELKVTWFY